MRWDSQKVEVCKEFSRHSRCEFPKCKFAHPESHVQQTPGDVMVCSDAARSPSRVCPRGDTCKHYHAFEGQQLPDNAPRMLGVCRDFFQSSTGCKRGTSCQFAHPEANVAMPRFVDLCLNFVIGKCSRDDCKYYHDVDSRVDHGMCRDFPDCPRGSHCQFRHPAFASRFSHPGGSKRGRQGDVPSLPEKVTDASRNCLDFFHSGKCSRGTSCKFVHSENPRAPMMPLGAPTERSGPFDPMRDSKYDKKRRVEPYEPIHPADPSRECLDFFHGRCSRGADCKFVHVTEAGGPTVNVGDVVADPAKECLEFFYGRCTRGNDCKFAHATVKADQDLRPPMIMENSRGSYDSKPYRNEFRYEPRHEQRYESRGSHGAMRPTHHDRREQEPCKEFVRGNCSRDNCKFLHDRSALCPEFKRGFCSRGNTCIFSHQEECHDFMHGRCTRGENCRFTHNPQSIIA